MSATTNHTGTLSTAFGTNQSDLRQQNNCVATASIQSVSADTSSLKTYDRHHKQMYLTQQNDCAIVQLPTRTGE